jgi:hypothetical protein
MATTRRTSTVAPTYLGTGDSQSTADYFSSIGVPMESGYTSMPQGFSAPSVSPAAPMAAPQDYGADYGTDYGMAAAAPITRPLGTSPEWLAYLSALGLEESQARADVDRMRGMYQSEAQRLKQDLVPQYGQQRRGITGSLEARGMARSGELLRRLAESRAAEGRQAAGIEANLAGQVGQLESQLAQRMGGLASQRAQQELALRAQGYV